MREGQRIQMAVASRHGDWQKGDVGEIQQVHVTPPENQRTIYTIKLDNGKRFWATDEDLMPGYRQMTIFDILQDEDQSANQPSDSSDHRSSQGS